MMNEMKYSEMYPTDDYGMSILNLSMYKRRDNMLPDMEGKKEWRLADLTAVQTSPQAPMPAVDNTALPLPTLPPMSQ